MNPINWNETYTNISPKLLGICRRYIKDIATAEDIVQDSFMVAIQKENTLKDKNALNGWLSRIVINMAIHHLKNQKKTVFSTSEIFEVEDNSTTMSTTELDNKSRLLASDLDRNDVLEAIDGLPEHHKSVFNMYVIDQFSHNEIAKTLDISVGTSKSHLSRARKSIQTFLLEKIKEKPIDEKKKRNIAFLIFLGFGNSMFGNFYRKSFLNFEIQPTQTFTIEPKNISFPNQFVGLNKIVSVSKILFMSLTVIILISTYFYFNQKNKVKLKQNEKQQITTVKTKSKIIESQKIISENELLKNKVSKTISKNTNQNSKNSSDKDTKKPMIIVKKDSIIPEPKKIIFVKKQIIKRDTIYVTK
jgi:RNA polymerase sigma factor (sigma-70 family)